MIDSCFSHSFWDEIGCEFPQCGRDAINGCVVGEEFYLVENGGDPGVGLSILDGAEGFPKCEFAKH